ncbi:MAG: BACON domain-containing protein, partial [Deltaproteobacteria bacterium]|nr:BACON domain-containing protein [Deltaproteobacteria bacterium]
VGYLADPAGDNQTRSGTIIIGSSSVIVTQLPPAPLPGCFLTLLLEISSFNREGGRGSISINSADDTCRWTIASLPDWIVFDNEGNQSGSDDISFTVVPLAGDQDRAGTITVVDQSGNIEEVSVFQDARTAREQQMVLDEWTIDGNVYGGVSTCQDNLPGSLFSSTWNKDLDQEHTFDYRALPGTVPTVQNIYLGGGVFLSL